MSYCRFSSDDFQCDLYCYGGQRGYVTHVAASRRTERSPSLEALLDNPTTEACDVYKADMEEWGKKPMVKIGLPHDGAMFEDTDLESFLATLVMLKDAGYKMPDYLIPDVRAELEEERAVQRDAQGPKG